MSLSRKFREWSSPPKVTSSVEGFTISIERKREAFFRMPTGKHRGPRQNDRSYYEVTVQPTGENPEYPVGQPLVHRFTHTLAKSYLLGSAYGQMTSGSRSFVAHDARYTGFEVVEEQSTPGPVLFGKPLPPHHAVKVKASYTDAAGEQHVITLDIEDWVRKSEKETPEWQAAKAAPFDMVHKLPSPEETAVQLEQGREKTFITKATVLQDNVMVKKPLTLKRPT